MNVMATEIKSELFQLAEGRKTDAKIRICRYLQHVGFLTVNLHQDLPPRSTSEICLDSEMIFYLTSLNELTTLQVPDDDSSPDANANQAVNVIQEGVEAPSRRPSFLASLCSKFKRSIWYHGRGRQEKLEGCEDYEKYSDSCGSESPSSVQTVIQNEELVIITPAKFPGKPKSTTNIFKLV